MSNFAQKNSLDLSTRKQEGHISIRPADFENVDALDERVSYFFEMNGIEKDNTVFMPRELVVNTHDQIDTVLLTALQNPDFTYEMALYSPLIERKSDISLYLYDREGISRASVLPTVESVMKSIIKSYKMALKVDFSQSIAPSDRPQKSKKMNRKSIFPKIDLVRVLGLSKF